MNQFQVQLTKDRENGVIAGVCAGVGRYFGVDATLVRAVFVAALVMSGFGAVLYLVLWIMLDDDQPLPPPAPPTMPVATDAMTAVEGRVSADLAEVADPVPAVPDDLADMVDDLAPRSEVPDLGTNGAPDR